MLNSSKTIYGPLDLFIEKSIITEQTGDLNNTDNTLSDSDSSVDFSSEDITTDDIVLISGSSSQDGYHNITAVSSTALDLDTSIDSDDTGITYSVIRLDYQVKGLQNDSITINETVEKEELEDGVERNLQRVLEINPSFSEMDEDDINKIQGYGFNLNHLVIQFPNVGKEIRVEDSNVQGEDYINYTAEIDDGKMSITMQKSSSDVNTANFTTRELTEEYTS